MGMFVQAKHGNMRGVVHGGMIATLADTACGYAIQIKAKGAIGSMVTTSLTVDFIGNAEVGQWIEARVEVSRIGRRMAFATCFIHCGRRWIAQATGTFLILGRTDGKAV